MSATIRSVGRETSRYSGAEGEFDFESFGAMYGGEFVYRGTVTVEAIDVDSIRWVGSSQGRPMDAADRARLLDALRDYFRDRSMPYNIRHPSGEIEDEAGVIHPGFRSGLPHVEHSEGWSLTDLFLSPEFPDAADYPPVVRYRDASGEAELPREVPTIDGERRRVLHPGALHWVGERDGEPMTDDDQTRIMSRIRSAYDEWGYSYELAD